MTLQLELEPKLASQIIQLAQGYGSPEAFILEILRRETTKTMPSWIGIGSSGRTDLGSNEELIFKES